MSKPKLRRVAISTAMVAAALCACPALAMQSTQSEAPPSSATAALAGEHMSVTVADVKGIVQFSNDDGKTWQSCTVGLVLGEGAEFRTGMRSSVTFTLPPNQTITLDRLGTIKVLQAIKQKDEYKTDVGMKYGRTKYEVQAAGIVHESTVRTPNSTLAVRGTNLVVSDERPFAPQAVHFDGVAEWMAGGRRQTLAHGTSTAVGGEAVADTALVNSAIDPNIAFARTEAEVPLVSNLLSRGAVVLTGNDKGLPIVRGGVPPTDAQLLKILPGRLDFVLRWDGPANLDLLVGGPGPLDKNGNPLTGGEVMYPAFTANTTPSGGLIPFDHQGGPNGGIELGYWLGNYPIGLYPVFVSNVGGKTVNYKIDVFADGERQQIVDEATQTSGTSFSGQISAGGQQGVVVGVKEFIPTSPIPFSTATVSPTASPNNVRAKTAQTNLLTGGKTQLAVPKAR